GDLIAFLDADDAWIPDKLEQQVQLFQANARTGVVYSRRILIDETGRELPYAQPQLHRGKIVSEMFGANFVCFSSAMVRRRVLDHVGAFDPRIDLAIDYELWLRAARHYEF